MARTPEQIKVYWDTQDPGNEGWAYNASDEIGLIDSGSIDVDDDIEDAIDDACRQLDITLDHDDFAIEHADGGFAIWTR